MKKIREILKSDKCLKLITGAGNEDLNEVKKLAYIYSKAGFNMIDVCAKIEVIKSAKEGIELAGKTGDISLCVSVGTTDDIHFSKANVNHHTCSLCGLCIKECPQNALFIEDGKVLTDEKRCIGCSKCSDICPNNAVIKAHKYKSPCEMLLPILSENIDCVEYHCISDNKEQILSSFNKIKSIYDGVISICLNRSKLGDDEVIELLKGMVNSCENIMIQADGVPMSGGNGSTSTTLECISFAQMIRTANINNFLILSGGTNAKTSELVHNCEVKIDGIAFGSYARKIVKEYTHLNDFFNNEEAKTKAVEKAIELKNATIKYL